MKSDKFAMSVSTFTRIGTGLLIFVLLARYLGPGPFGVFAAAMVYATLLGLVADYGLGTYALCEAGAHQGRGATIVMQALMVKLITTGLVTLGGLAALGVVGPVRDTLIVTVAVYIGLMATSFADLCFVTVRAVGRYDIEARTVVATSFVSVAAIAWVTIASEDIAAAALCFMVTRLVYLATSWVVLRPFLAAAAVWPIKRSDLLRIMRQASPYAIDGLLVNLSNQIDVVMVSLLLSHVEIGLYQAGAKLLQGVAPVSAILAMVYLPKLAEAHQSGDVGRRNQLAAKLNLEFVGIATIGFFGFMVFGPLWTIHVYGPEFSPLIPLWPGLSCFILFRFTASAYGIELTALGEMRYRIGTYILVIGAVVIGSLIALPRYGVAAAPWILAGSGLILLLIYGFISARYMGSRRIVAYSLAWSLLLLAAALLFAAESG